MPKLTHIVCPESGRIVEIGYDIHPIGMLVRSCTRLRALGTIDCSRSCTHRIAERDAGDAPTDRAIAR